MQLATSAWAGGWFQAPLDYWQGSPYGLSPPPPSVEAPESSASGTRADPEGRPFSWSDYTDPSSPTFWREGDHVPPAPLLELIADPSPENVERYRQWTSKKLEVSAWVSELLSAASEPEPVGWQGVAVVYLYASSCGYCQKNTPHVLELIARGADVMPVHLDRPSSAYPSSTPWTAEMGALVPMQGTPTWVLVADGQRRTVRGFATVQRLEDELRALRGRGP